MRTELVDFERKNLFENYNTRLNPFVFVSTKIDITNIYKNCKNYYPTIAYFITLAASKIDNFKYRYEDNKFYKYDVIRPNFTETLEDGNIWFFTCDFKDNYKEFLEHYKNVKDEFFKNNESCSSNRQDEFWFSCTPWFNMTSIIPPFDKTITIPQFIWDKFNIENDKCYINLMIMVHHGFVDGYHINLFLKEFNNIIKNIENYI